MHAEIRLVRKPQNAFLGKHRVPDAVAGINWTGPAGWSAALLRIREGPLSPASQSCL